MSASSHRGQEAPATARRHGGPDRRARWRPLTVAAGLLLSLLLAAPVARPPNLTPPRFGGPTRDAAPPA